MYLDKLRSPEFWRSVREDDRYRFIIDHLLAEYEQYGHGEIADISYDAFMHYHRTGSRHEFESKYYFPRRNRMRSSALLALIFPEKEEYFANLCNTVWAILNEYSWSLPNHDAKAFVTYSDDHIDLFAAETGWALSEIRYLFREKLGPVLNERISHALDRRIIRSFINCFRDWERVETNWSAVCAGSVAITFMRERPDLYDLVRPRIESAMSCFLSGFREDGVCQEGFAYWCYGFGFFLCYAQALLEFTDGKENLFQLEKVRKVAQFPNYVYLSGKSVISFSDGPLTCRMHLSPASILRHHYGDAVLPKLPKEYYTTDAINSSFGPYAMTIAFFDPDMEFSSEQTDMTAYLEHTGWFMHKNSRFGFAAKAGNNAEPHNHNDIGSFILASGGEQLLCDLGSGEYTRDYFSHDKRYTILCNRSLGHSVPLLDGMEQASGREFCGEMSVSGQSVVIDLTKAYPENRVSSCVRRFELDSSGFTLTDTFAYTQPCPVTERFATVVKPELAGDTIRIGSLTLTFSADWQCAVSIEKHNVHEADRASIDVYMLDFRPKSEPCVSFTLTAQLT